jgi:acyl-CoA synthetase (NDP forming)
VSATNPDLGGVHEYGDKLALKILSHEIVHKTEVGGVALNVSKEDVSDRINSMLAEVKSKSGATINEFLVQEMVSGGMEFMVGMHRDPLGTAILVGMGGVTAELFKDTHMRLITPGKAFGEQEALEMLQELKTWPLLDGYRGRPKCDVGALVKAIVQFSELVACLDDRLLECEINPIFVFADGKGVKAADGIAILR